MHYSCITFLLLSTFCPPPHREQGLPIETPIPALVTNSIGADVRVCIEPMIPRNERKRDGGATPI
jgi:hypothetical protein